MADHILEMAGLGLLCGFVSQKYIAKAGYLCWMPQIISKAGSKATLKLSINYSGLIIEHDCNIFIFNYKALNIENGQLKITVVWTHQTRVGFDWLAQRLIS